MVASGWQRAADVLVREAADATVVLPRDADEPLVLRNAGLLVWRLLDRPRTEPELVDTLAELTDTPADEVRRQVVALLDDLLDAGVVVAS